MYACSVPCIVLTSCYYLIINREHARTRSTVSLARHTCPPGCFQRLPASSSCKYRPGVLLPIAAPAGGAKPLSWGLYRSRWAPRNSPQSHLPTAQGAVIDAGPRGGKGARDSAIRVRCAALSSAVHHGKRSSSSGSGGRRRGVSASANGRSRGNGGSGRHPRGRLADGDAGGGCHRNGRHWEGWQAAVGPAHGPCSLPRSDRHHDRPAQAQRGHHGPAHVGQHPGGPPSAEGPPECGAVQVRRRAQVRIVARTVVRLLAPAQ